MGSRQTVPDLAEVVQVAHELARGRRDDVDECLGVILAGLRQRLGFDVAFVGQFVNGSRVFRAADSAVSSSVVRQGGSDPVEDTFCARVVDGRLPEYVPDAAAHPSVRALPATLELPVGTHLSVPIQFSDGTVYGTLCGYTCVPDPAVQERELGVMRLVARLLGRHLEHDDGADDRAEAARLAVLAVLAEDGPDVVFQPVRDLSTMHVVGYEALSRFGGEDLPDTWFARAAFAGLGVALEVAAVRNALARLDDVVAGRYVAVNVSAEALCSDDLLAVLGGCSGAPDLSRVVLELTEQTGVPDYDLLRTRVAWLRERGARVAVDDAGAGHAGLQRIVEIAPDVIKLDRGLVQTVATDPARQAMVQALVWFARRTGTSLVAEGVETEEELVALRELGVLLGQGYRLGRPAELP